jgi:7,8-dihydropterin-6-yl-methyl-4-(beta-D-ribofuranosyl)aminobenzene 5'-phosphate synthase
MKIISLLENTTKQSNIATEHGLSIYIETKKHKILFDMGQTDLFYKNAQELGIDLSTVDIAILSHGHYDHGGGLGRFLEINTQAKVYVSSLAFEPHYNGTEKYIGLDTLLTDTDRLVFIDDEFKIDESLYLFSCNNKTRSFPPISHELTKKINEVFMTDDFLHEQYLMIEENGKRVLLSGCSHKGILNISDWFSPDVLIGGFHFSKLGLDNTLKEFAEELNRYPTKYYTCHCTGMAQYEFMKKYMDNLNYLACGDCVTV